MITIKKRLWKKFASCFSSFDIFSKAFAKCTEHSGCMVINHTKEGNVSDKVFWYKQQQHQKLVKIENLNILLEPDTMEN